MEVNERGKIFYKALRDLVERMYKHSFHLQNRNHSNDSKNQILFKLQEEFPENCSMKHVRILIKKRIQQQKRRIEKVIFL